MISMVTRNATAVRTQGVGMPQVEDLKQHFGQMLTGSDSWSDLYHSKYKVNGVGITKVGSSYALDVMNETKDGRDATIQKLLSMPGAKPLPDAQPLGGLRDGDQVLSLPYKGQNIPVVVSYVGLIQAQ